MAMKLLHIKVPDELLARIDAAISATGASRSEWVRRAIEARLESDGAPAETARPRTASPALSTARPVTTKAPAAHPTSQPLARQGAPQDRDVTPRFK